MKSTGLLILLATLTIANFSVADQNDPRLDGLFRELMEVEAGNRADEITRTIWEVWTETDNPEVARLMGLSGNLMSRRNYGDALKTLNEVVTIAPEFAEGWNRRATLYYLIGDYSASALDVRKTLELEPRHFGALAGLGLLYMENQSYNAAITAFESALQANPHLPGPRMHIEVLRKVVDGTRI